MFSDNVKRVSVVGGSGYAGAELCALLENHRGVELSGIFGTSAAPDARPFSLPALLHEEPDFVFLATPDEASSRVAPEVLEARQGTRIVDLSGAFRLSPDAVYGLTEWCNGELEEASLVANPGCYPTSILLALKPLLPVLDLERGVVCDSASGVSGAGKKSDFAFSFTELFGNFKAYGVGNHRHLPEIRRHLGLPEGVDLVFTPHLLPVARGIVSTIHVCFSRPVSEPEVASRYSDVYESRPFVRVRPAGDLPDLKAVVGTPRCEIGFALLPGGKRAVLVSALDNLLKGAASQALQNFNRMCGFPEAEGLQ